MELGYLDTICQTANTGQKFKLTTYRLGLQMLTDALTGRRPYWACDSRSSSSSLDHIDESVPCRL